MPEPFESLREMLLRQGVAPAHVRRYLHELSEHFFDLVGEALKAGASLAEARASARARLGSDEALAGAMLAEPSLRSWTGRAPWATLLVGPIVMLALPWTLAVLGIALLLGWPHHTNGLPQPPARLPQDWVAPVGTALLDLAQVGGPLLIGSYVALLGARQRSRLIWPLLGCVAVAVLGASLHWNAHWPVAGSSERGLSIGFGGFLWSRSLAMAAFSLTIAGAVYWMARPRRLATA